MSLNSEIFVDKSELLDVTNRYVNTQQRFMCVSRPRRFGKSMAADMLAMCILMDIIGSVKVFDLVFAMTGGGPNGLTNLPTTLMYNEAFKYNHYGVGSAIGISSLPENFSETAGSHLH